MVTEDICDIFSIFHDGSISEWSFNNKILTLTIECLYLAEKIKPSYDRFYLECKSVEVLSLTPWLSDMKAIETYTDPNQIFQSELEISSAKREGDTIIITCYQHDHRFNYSGGNLALQCETAKIFDHERNPLSIDQLNALSKSYWDNYATS